MACGHHPLSKRGPPPGDFIFQARKAGDSNATVLPAHRLAGEPGTPVRFTFHFPVPFIFHFPVRLTFHFFAPGIRARVCGPALIPRVSMHRMTFLNQRSPKVVHNGRWCGHT